MPEEVLFESETRLRRDEIASHLRAVADRLNGDGELTLSGGGDSLTMAVPESATFEVKAERETGSGPDELSVEFELEWDEGDGAEGGIDIE
ncbi:amphi-Trp domain-containing protein [Halobaculum sp. EA56]|uniref:amphi-Trp domain-containing protein n=1 Tax=Halobaculum sp. EA56 TaxID=3421648 RepID=UPI003EBB6107